LAAIAHSSISLKQRRLQVDLPPLARFGVRLWDFIDRKRTIGAPTPRIRFNSKARSSGPLQPGQEVLHHPNFCSVLTRREGDAASVGVNR
jgi:hypothetical protein